MPESPERKQFISILETSQLAREGLVGTAAVRVLEQNVRDIELRISKKTSELETEEILGMYLAAIHASVPTESYQKINGYALSALAFAPETEDSDQWLFEIVSFGVYAAAAIVENGGKAEVLRSSFPLVNRLALYLADGKENPDTRESIGYFGFLCNKNGINIIAQKKPEIPTQNEHLYRFVMENRKGSAIEVYWQVAQATFRDGQEGIELVSKFGAYADVESGYYWKMAGMMSSHLEIPDDVQAEELLVRIVKALRPCVDPAMLEREAESAAAMELFAASAYLLIVAKSMVRLHLSHHLIALDYGSKEEKAAAMNMYLGLSYRLYKVAARKGFPKGLDVHYLENYFKNYGKEITAKSSSLLATANSKPVYQKPIPPKEAPRAKSPVATVIPQSNSEPQKPTKVNVTRSLSGIERPKKPSTLTYYLVGIPIALLLAIVVVKTTNNSTNEKSSLELPMGAGVESSDTPPDLRSPEGVVRGFLYYMDKQDFHSAYNLGKKVPAWRSFDEFSATSGFGGIDSSSIHRLKEISINEGQSKIEVEVFMRDPVNGDGKFTQEFEVSYSGEVWQITKHRTISSDRPQDNFKLEVKAGKHPLSDERILQDALPYFPKCRILSNAIVGCEGSSGNEGGSPEETSVGLKHYFKQQGNMRALVLLQTSMTGYECNGEAHANYHSEAGFTSAGLYEMQNNAWALITLKRAIADGSGWGEPGEIGKIHQFGLDNLAVQVSTGYSTMGEAMGNLQYIGVIGNQLKRIADFQDSYDNSGRSGKDCWVVGSSFLYQPNGRYRTLKLEKVNCSSSHNRSSKSIEIEIGADGRYVIPEDF